MGFVNGNDGRFGYDPFASQFRESALSRYTEGGQLPGAQTLYGSEGVPHPGIYPGLGALGQVQHGNNELPGKLSETKQINGQVNTLISAINLAYQQNANALSGSPQEGLLSGAQAAVQALQTAQANMEGSFAAGSVPHGSFEASTSAWNAMDEAGKQARAALTSYGPIPAQLASEGKKAGAAAVASQQATLQAERDRQLALQQSANATLLQQQKDNSLVNAALTKAQAFAAAGNYAGALAAVQAQNVIDAATRIDREGDLDTVAAAIGGQQAFQGQCAQRGGNWTGNSCDMTGVQSAAIASAVQAASDKVDAAIGQAGALSSAGNYRGALTVLSGALNPANASGRTPDVQLAIANVQQAQQDAADAQKLSRINSKIDAVIGQANAYAASGNYASASAVLSTIMGDASMVGRDGDVITAQTAIEQARIAALSVPTPAAPAAGGQSDSYISDSTGFIPRDGYTGGQAGDSYIEGGMSQNVPGSYGPSLDQRILDVLTRFFGSGTAPAAPSGGGMALGIPGGAPGLTVSSRSPYEGNFGAENF